jgi:hypothetical protein
MAILSAIFDPEQAGGAAVKRIAGHAADALVQLLHCTCKEAATLFSGLLP